MLKFQCVATQGNEAALIFFNTQVSASAMKVRKQITQAVSSSQLKYGEWLEDGPKKHYRAWMKANLGRGCYTEAVKTNQARADWHFSMQKAPEKNQGQ